MGAAYASAIDFWRLSQAKWLGFDGAKKLANEVSQ